ncbi:flagellin N-terminal helical domain-containing protein [Grimontia hollisae]|uniref:flagellin N-terminal helical domain-containing protein n=1 Tax=Grimontia hollisae TaxID=673 RepID=UPI000DFFF406|nr:flagellin [Grimontia hollisae]STQ77827.1 A-type flagellin [Grimontia hollisae]
MAMTINTNFASMNAQRNLLGTQSSLNTSLQRLSTGLRINSAKDDAAGLQIANRMTSQINGLNVAKRNANDGISMAQTAEGALQEYTNILHRMRDLGVQAKNGTNSESDRAALNKEFQQMKKELDRITETTTYGKGEKLFEKLSEGVNFQVGAESTNPPATDVKTLATADKYDAMQLVDDAMAGLGLDVNSEEDVKKIETLEKALTGLSGGSSAGTEVDLTNLGLTASTSGNDTEKKAADLAAAKELLSDLGITGVTLEQGTNAGKVKVKLDDELKADFVKQKEVATALKPLVDKSTGELDETKFADNTVDVKTLAEKMNDAGMASEILQPLDPNVINVKVDSEQLNATKLGGIESVDSAGNAINAIDDMIDAVGSIRADLGATQNRFQSTINNLGNIAENMAVAKGRIMDADIAAESANMTKQNTMMQAGITVLSQANQMPSMVSQLLR